MARRYASKNAAVAVAGTTFTHGLTNDSGAAATPDEWAVNHRTAPSGGYASIYVASVSSSAVIVASGSGATTGDVFAWVNHTIIQ